MADKTDAQRLSDIKEMLKRAKPKDEVSLVELAAIWGTTKPRFVNKRAEIADFPEPMRVEKNAHIFPLKAALTAMKNYLERHQNESAAKAALRDRLIGVGAAKKTADNVVDNLSVTELVKLNQLAFDLEERERKKRIYIAAAEVERLASMIFSEISNFLSNLSKRVDPHGRLPGAIRKHIDSMATKVLLSIHGRIKALLQADADNQAGHTTDGKARRGRVRR